MATTSTHDLPTVTGWWKGVDIEWNEKLDRLPEGRGIEDVKRERAGEREALWAAFRHAELTQEEVPHAEEAERALDKALIFVAETPCDLLLVPVEDLLALDQQPNLPGTIDEHPNWRRRLPLPASEILSQEAVIERLVLLRSRRSTDGAGGSS